MPSRRFQPLALLAPLLVACAALACPNCETARQVRASIREDGHFWSYLLMMALPLLLIAAVSALLYRVGLPEREDG
jgi:hypothetical protein